MDAVTESMDYSHYDMLWLGGDLALSTSADDVTMQHVDSIFDLDAKSTLWALGNHDYADLDRIQNYTGRPPYYAYHQNDITFLILDTQDSLSNLTGAQKDLVLHVIDTIAESSHLILLHHKLIWMYGDPYLQPQISYVPNGGLGDCFYCINPNNFHDEIYPKLMEVEAKGIEVICIAGDIGVRRNEFEYLTPEGIQYLASGIEAGNPYNQALLFSHDQSNRTLSWEFILLSELQSVDSSPPSIYSVSISPDSIARGNTISMALVAEDLESGLDEISAEFVNPLGEQLQTFSNHIGDWTSWGDRLYTYDLFIADNVENGTWELATFTVSDSAGNRSCLSREDSVLATFIVFTPLGAEQLSSFQLSLFPNPSSGVIYFSSEKRIETAEIFDQNGRLLHKIVDLKTQAIDFSGKPQGMYYVRLSTSDRLSLTKKVIITKHLKP